MKRSHFLAVSAVLVLIAAAVAAWLYPHLPARVPSHWDASGHVDGYTTRLHGAMLPALMLAGTALVGVVLPLISPRRFAITPFAKVYFGLLLVVEGFMLVTGLAVLLAAAGHDVPVVAITLLGTGVLFLVLGNYMGKMRKNFFIGIRTPWTLADDDVWERTHRLGGRLFMLVGVLFLVAGVVGGMTWVPVAAIVIAAVIPIVYSWVAYVRVQRRRHPPHREAATSQEKKS